MLKTKRTKQIIINYYLKKGGKKMLDEIKLELKLEQFHQKSHVIQTKEEKKLETIAGKDRQFIVCDLFVIDAWQNNKLH